MNDNIIKGDMNMKQLPEGFLWGGATADFQYEGGFNEGGRGLLSHDYETDGSLEHPRAHTLQRADVLSLDLEAHSFMLIQYHKTQNLSF